MSDQKSDVAKWHETRFVKWPALALRLLVGALFLLGGLEKISDAENGTIFVAEFLSGHLGDAPYPYDLFMQYLALPNVAVFFWLVALGESLLGLSLLLGAKIRLSGIAGIAMICNFMLAKGFAFPQIAMDAILVLLLVFLILARAGRTWGLDGRQPAARSSVAARFLRMIRWSDQTCLALAAIACSLCAFDAHAGELAPAADGQEIKLSPTMEPLSGLIGRWRVIAWTQSDTGEWTALPPSESRYIPTLAGHFIAATGTLNVAAGSLEFTETFGFDPFQKSYRMTWNDSAVGLMDVYEGTIEDRKLIVTNLESGTFWVTPEGESFAFKLEIELDAPKGRREVRVFQSTDRGKEWSLFQRTDYRLIVPDR